MKTLSVKYVPHLTDMIKLTKISSWIPILLFYRMMLNYDIEKLMERNLSQEKKKLECNFRTISQLINYI